MTEHFRSSEIGLFQSLPGVFFFYDLSPIKVGFLLMAIHKKYLLVLQIYLVMLVLLELLRKLFLCDSGTCTFTFGLIFIVSSGCIPQVTFTEGHISFLHFLTNVCAIVGGNFKASFHLLISNLSRKHASLLMLDWMHNNNVWVLCSGVFTVSGILDSFIYHGHRAVKKKMEIGKFSWWSI